MALVISALHPGAHPPGVETEESRWAHTQFARCWTYATNILHGSGAWACKLTGGNVGMETLQMICNSV